LQNAPAPLSAAARQVSPCANVLQLPAVTCVWHAASAEEEHALHVTVSQFV
jgi:hypothetical protein